MGCIEIIQISEHRHEHICIYFVYLSNGFKMNEVMRLFAKVSMQSLNETKNHNSVP